MKRHTRTAPGCTFLTMCLKQTLKATGTRLKMPSSLGICLRCCHPLLTHSSPHLLGCTSTNYSRTTAAAHNYKQPTFQTQPHQRKQMTRLQGITYSRFCGSRSLLYCIPGEQSSALCLPVLLTLSPSELSVLQTHGRAFQHCSRVREPEVLPGFKRDAASDGCSSQRQDLLRRLFH